ncbi:LuxR C-terminal-related transcriptional regulator [Raoultibacter phocaeensis]|uniref:LuxR C-terminal-related transcriptional regulator n=1 Tax=Raoultibacter phocaeensis TaxID=2479841 RepID=UPI00111AB400|nr:LuxR C-terminal-related transcriptional regulator [Raoultibacter phocaeensis]
MKSTNSQIDTKQLATGKRYLAAVVGFTCLYAVCVSFFYSSWLMDRPDFSPAAFDNVLNPSIFATSVLLSLLVSLKLCPKRAPFLVIGYAGFAVALGSAWYAATMHLDPLIVSVSAGAAGVGMGLVMPFYFEAFARYSPRRIAIAFGIMSLGGMALNIAVGFMPDAVSLPLYAMLLIASAACLAFTKPANLPADGEDDRARRAPAARTALSKHEFLDVFLVSGVCTFALSIVYGILDTAATGSSASPAHSVLISQFGGIAAAIVFLAYFGTRAKPAPSLLFNVVFGILATGILFLPFLSSGYAVSLNILAAAGWKLVMLALFYLVVTTYARSRTKLLVGISLAYALPRFGLFIGQNVAQLLGVGSTADFVCTTAVAFFLLYLILMVIWMVNSHERKRAESQARAADELLGRFAQGQENVRKLRSNALAEEHGLTNRESDILYLLAQGRDLAFICETLFLSKNTVKSYQKTIYSKLGVHSKQEIIDLVHDQADAEER